MQRAGRGRVTAAAAATATGGPQGQGGPQEDAPRSAKHCALAARILQPAVAKLLRLRRVRHGCRLLPAG